MEKTDLNQSENENVKSRAIVKYSVPKPTQFMKLQCNTDLNLPPSNWLSSSADSYGLQHMLYHPKGFSSFRMAHMFPDTLGEVDIVSDAENIKNLLKMPYDKGQISMMVHRIGNTLLLDNFDIYKHLMKTAETEWEWLRKFFFEHIDSDSCEEDRSVYIKNRRRDALKQKSLVSKFLYHSLVESEVKENVPDFPSNSLPVKEQPPLPEPSPSEKVPDSNLFDHKFNRNVVWTFEDIEMLLGTDMPIFGGGTHPCISLRLRDMSKPISVLTGIDYWLDNLMSNVPEVVMCYHLNGIVQKYELVKTEDLPRLDNSKFSPKLIRDVAQSILSFLKSNATKAGHTYWLFKGKDEEVVKLYDLTSLCSEKDVENGQNPFTIPVAMLLYRVARNMKHSADRRQPGTIRMLLKNCIKLLPEEKYPEIVTSSHYMLSDLYVPACTNPESPGLDLEQNEFDDTESLYDDDDEPQGDSKDAATKILVLGTKKGCQFVNYYKNPPPIAGGLTERCLQAIQHIIDGLNCLKYFANGNLQSKVEEEIPMAKPFEPIPMPYSKLNEATTVTSTNKKGKKKKENKKNKIKVEEVEANGNALLLKSKNVAQPLPTWQENNGTPNISWKDHLKTLLYEKIVLIYAILSEHHYISGNYGSSLRNIGLLARCQLVMNRLLYTSNALRENCLLGRAGDCCVMMVQNWKKSDCYRNELQTNLEEDLKIMEQLEADEQNHDVRIGESNMKCVFLHDIRTIEQMLLTAVECYEEALKISKTDSIYPRLGNSLNELASFYLNKARNSKTETAIIDACKQAEPYLSRGLAVFEAVKDDSNVALLYTNRGHLHRLLTYAYKPNDRDELTAQEKVHYNKAFFNYKRALQVLADRKHSPGIWDAVNWELSTSLFNMASIMHEHPSSNLTTVEAEKEVIEVLQQALKYCDLNEDNSKYPLYQYRAAVIHYRIGSVYHSHIWSTTNDLSNRKNLIQLAKINYEKASKFYLVSNDAVNYLTAQMQRFALSEFLAETATSTTIKIKHLQNCLEIVIEIDELVQMLDEKKIVVNEDEEKVEEEADKKKFKTCHSLLDLVKQRLHHVLKTLIKLCLTKPTPNKDCVNLANVYKNLYKISFDLRDGLEFEDLVSTLHLVLNQIKIDLVQFYLNNK